MRRFLILAFAFVLLAEVAWAQQLKLEIRDGRVNLDATAVSVRQILAEWARIGGTRVVGGDKVTGAPLTLKLVAVSERQALDIILRSVAGYMAAPRATSSAGTSGYDRILILPTSVAPAAPVAAQRTASQGPAAGTERRVPPRPPAFQAPRPPDTPDNDANETAEADQADTGVAQQPVFTFPQPQPQAPGNQVFMPAPPPVLGRPGQPGTVAAPVITLQPNPNGQPAIYNFVPLTGGMPAPATGGFTVIGSPTPGMIQQPPVVTQPPQNRPPTQ